MVPSNEPLESDDLIRGHRDDRLIQQAELAALERLLEVALQLQLGLVRLQDAGIEHFAVRSAEYPCPVQRRLRIAEYILRLRVASCTHGDADARGEKHFTAVHRERREHLLEEPIGYDLCVADGFQAVEQDGELIAFDARHDVVAAKGGSRVRDAEARLQTPRGSGQQRSR